MKTIFIFGRLAALSLSELVFTLKRLNWPNEFLAVSPSAALLEVKNDFDVDFLMRQLGGTVKIAAGRAVLRGTLKEKIWEEIFPIILDLIKKKAESAGAADKKIFFGLSFYGRKTPPPQWGLALKKKLEQQGVKSRLVTSREKTLSAVSVKLNKLLSRRGMEILVVFDGQKIWIGETLAVQPFDEFSQRDFGRPERDAYSGMLPPKLAKIIINLAELPLNSTILDPFCGSGTILSEAILMGYENIRGSDVSEKAIANTKKNLQWLAQNSKLNDQQPFLENWQSQIKRGDARQLSKFFQPSSIDAIITEPFLGPPFRGGETTQQINKIIRDLSSLYLASLKEFKKVLKLGGRVAMIWPVFNKNKFLPLENEIKKMGFGIEPLLPSPFTAGLTKRNTLVYSRPEQKVAREIVKLIRL
ncbi:MAG: RsmD family RNA methyltransferase [Candidatus Magasanikbacteria bacterium]|nr:RsmD family RNA methyltransferase [Candidatus Magasanikbacteria bacterium]